MRKYNAIRRLSFIELDIYQQCQGAILSTLDEFIYVAYNIKKQKTK
jgi:hypothetical protein